MAQSDWGDIWTWSSAAPPPTDPTKNWFERDEPAWDVYGTGDGYQLVWEKTNSDSGEFTGRFYASGGASSGTTKLMRGGCKFQNNGNWGDRTGLFFGNPSFREGNAYGGTEQDEINGIMVGFSSASGGSTAAIRRLYSWRIQEGVVVNLGYYDVPALVQSIDSSHGSIFEFQAAVLVDDSQYLRGGYNNGVYDANRVTGTSYARPFVKWNTAGGYSTTSVNYVWNSTNLVTTTDTSEVSVGDFIKATGTINWYRITFIDPNTSLFIDISGRPTPPTWNNTADYFDPNATASWTDWQLVTEANDWITPNLMKRMIEGDYCVGIAAVGTGWSAGGTNQAVFDNVSFYKGATP